MGDDRPAGLPPLPDVLDTEQLKGFTDAELESVAAELRAAERATVAAMSPYERQLREVRARLSEIATERRRRKRASQVAQRASVRQAAKQGDMPTLIGALEATDTPLSDDMPLAAVRAFLSTGGEVGFGFATRPGTIAFTDGRRQEQARTWGEARQLYARGWEPGTPGIPGVRVHLAGSRVERVAPAGEVVLEVSA